MIILLSIQAAGSDDPFRIFSSSPFVHPVGQSHNSAGRMQKRKPDAVPDETEEKNETVPEPGSTFDETTS